MLRPERYLKYRQIVLDVYGWGVMYCYIVSSLYLQFDNDILKNDRVIVVLLGQKTSGTPCSSDTHGVKFAQTILHIHLKSYI